MKYLKVMLWGHEIGRLVWDAPSRRTYFLFNPNAKDDIPDIAPLVAPIKYRNLYQPIFGDDNPLYHGLPLFIADSLPDSWGNTLFEKWVKDSKIPRNKITPLYKLTFIGTRGMGALEYEPSAAELNHTNKIDLNSLYDMGRKILEDRERIVLNAKEELTLQALLAVGTSAGGRQMKAIIALNEATGEIRSGQSEGLEGFQYYILKFGDIAMPLAEIETAYFKMAKHALIDMEDSRLFPAEGINHFITRRFDRKDGKKIHVQTLAAINPAAGSYEDLVATCRELALPETAVEQVFRRMVFNVMGNNTDDHNKNFSFMLEQEGKWNLAPAYDVTFIFNLNGTGPQMGRRMSINGKRSNINKEDLLEFAQHNDIKNPTAIIDQVADALSNFEGFAESALISQPWRSIIQRTLDTTLAEFGYKNKIDTNNIFTDSSGRSISDFSVSFNSKMHYLVSATIDGKPRKRFIRPNNPLYEDLEHLDIFNLPPALKLHLISRLFP